MARKCTYTKEMILEAAIQLFKKEGSDAITAKNIAKELNCSVAPIYSVYLSLDDLKKDLAFEIEKNILEENNVHPLLSKMFSKLELDENNDDEFSEK
ncbi:TetR/AcrR family transcriptional regulator, partial [Fusobacterium nucleatum]